MSQCRLFVLLIALFMLSACANTSIVSRPTSSVTAYKLSQARVVWKDNATLPMSVIKDARGYQPTIDEDDKTYSRFVLTGIVSLFRKSAPAIVQEQLSGRGVMNGSATIVELWPVQAGLRIGGGRGCDIRVSIKDGTTDLWSVTIKASGPPWEKDQAILEQFVATLASELANAGWI